ncbi:2-succinyl-5-enolpyruvyl-6-hydroxy-3-cyclohexene-1-carboxylic-acid synthase [Microlunatus sp. GCM10028923]|uniref:2-succinyl-5-enolpyruvyl-6-hydroxy-3- cyclohexene-1-carboxylic-acid synthase n=1 Tax=Microlunatus sp. GCM10028923 TaxID=3273400 RepID=UPI0036121601
MTDATQCARTVIEELISRGVREIVVAPGSRSAPLAYEIFEADRIDLLRLHIRTDERSAGFTALGLAKASGEPVAVITTSGTAVANLHPAVLEAAHSRIPLIMITADRPGFLIGTGANQTTEQRSLFADHVVASAQFDDHRGDVRHWQFHTARLVVAATGERTADPGPVHLNIAFSDPLTPTPVAINTRPPVIIESPARTVEPAPVPAGPQTVIIAGDTDPETGARAAAMAEQSRLPLFAEPSSNARRGAAAIAFYRLLLTTELADEIERVIVIGHPTLSRPVSRLLARDDVEIIAVTPYARWDDAGVGATRVVAAVAPEPSDPAWLDRWRDHDQRLAALIDRRLADDPDFTGPGLARTVWAALGGQDTLFTGSSNPVRDLDLAPISAVPPVTYANRGLAGIDGSASTAAGIALAIGRPTHALLGDLTFLHDLGGLIIGPEEPRPDLRVIVANDNGGSIFATLEYGAPSHLRAFERIFGTAHTVDLERLAGGLGAHFHRVQNEQELSDVLAEPPLGIEVVEATIDRRHRRTLNAQLQQLTTNL